MSIDLPRAFSAVYSWLRGLSPFVVLLALLGTALVLSAGFGAVPIPPLEVIRILAARRPFFHGNVSWSSTAETILIQIRLPRILLVALTGAALGGSGAAYQGLFRNPLADPYLIGIAAGAGLGAIVAMALQWPLTLGGLAIVPLSAFVAALLTTALVYAIARVGKTTPLSTLILAGVAVGSFASAVTTFLMLRAHNELHRAVAWLLGGYALGGWLPVLVLTPYVLAGVSLLAALGRPINVLQFGEEQAQQMGLNVERLKLVLVVLASLVTAAAVSFAGLIGFVGLVAPHTSRLLWGPDYRRLIPLSALSGSIGLLLADLLARTLIAPQEIPLGVITALIGVPFFLWLLRGAKRQAFW